MNIREHFVRNQLSLDPRSLGLFRMLLGCGLLFVLCWRLVHLDALHTDALHTHNDLLPNRLQQWTIPVRPMFSWLVMASAAAGTRFGIVLCGIVFGMLTVGYRTRLFQVLTALCVVILDPRVLLPENFGHTWLSLLAVSSVFLPLGRRFSVDALVQSMRAHPEYLPKQLAFRAAMRPSLPPMLSGHVWDRMEQRLRRGGVRLTCFFDADCGICFQFARILARLDIWERIHLVSNQDREQLPHEISDDVVANTIVVRDHRTGRVTTRSDAIAELCRALPLGSPVWFVLKLPGLRGVWLRAYDLVAKNRVAVSQFFGLNACGLPSPIGLPHESDAGVSL